MGRISKAYEAQFRGLLSRLNARRVDKGVLWLREQARRRSAEGNIPLAEALTQVFTRVVSKRVPAVANGRMTPEHFFCDAGLGGLARWLRGAGYDASWEAGIGDGELLLKARQVGATVLTTDSMLMERKLLRDRLIPSFWVPPALGNAEQLKLVFREFGLTVRTPRCMQCGGELRRGDKQDLRERIPPRTYRWLDEFFVCSRCGKLFWHGTHWRRIRKELQRVAEESARIT